VATGRGDVTVLQYVLAACALACPLSMLAMVWVTRRHRRHDQEE
jgi:hypothetical protein